MVITRKTVQCDECFKKTTDYYPVPTNKGKAHRCKECYENSIRRGAKMYQLNTEKNNYERK